MNNEIIKWVRNGNRGNYILYYLPYSEEKEFAALFKIFLNDEEYEWGYYSVPMHEINARLETSNFEEAKKNLLNT